MTDKEVMQTAVDYLDAIVQSDWRTWQELAGPEEFERWVKSRANKIAIDLREALAQPVQPTTGCACKWAGDVYESRCELHEAWHVAIREWAERAKDAEAKLAQPEPEPKKNQFKPDYDTQAVLVEEMQRMAKQIAEMQDWEAIAADQALTIAMMKCEQEPVAWMSEDAHTVYTSKQVDGCFQHDHIPLYTHLPQRTWVGLTNEQIWQIATDSTIGGDLHADKFARAIEAAHGIKEQA